MSDEDPDMCQKHAKPWSNRYIWTIKKQYFEDAEIEGYTMMMKQAAI